MAEKQNAATRTQQPPPSSAKQDTQRAGAQSGEHRVATHRPQQLSPLWAANPFALMRQFSMDFDRLFGDVPGYGPSTPQIEVFERGEQFVVRADLPGLDKNDVAVELADNMLTISGERRDEHVETRHGVRVSERQYGHFVRRVPLPDGISGEDARATFQNGVLEITMPTPSGHQRGRRIDIEDGAGASASPSTRQTDAGHGA